MAERSLLVTNDYPPKIGGIQNYLWELWRRLPADRHGVYTTPYDGANRFDAAQNHWIGRSAEPFLIPYPWLPKRIRRLAQSQDRGLIILDPALPLGAIGPGLGLPYAVVIHGAEAAIPARIPGLAPLLGRVLANSSLVISAGEYALAEAARTVGHELPSVVIPPGVDTDRFCPADPDTRLRLRARWGFQPDEVVLATVNRLVPRKGMETLIEAAARVARRSDGATGRLRVCIGGTGRQEAALGRLVNETGAPVQLLGRLSDNEVVELYQAADMMAMVCNERWFGLEQEGFGIAFLEAAACGLPQVAGRSGGSHEAVVHDVTGLIVDRPRDVEAVATAVERLVVDGELRAKMGRAAREWAVGEFNYDILAGRLREAIEAVPVGR